MQQAITWANVGPDHITIWLHLNQCRPKSCHHMASLCHNGLTHWGWVTYICVSKPGPAPSHYLNQCRNIVDWTLGNKLQWNLNPNSDIFIQENATENVVWKMAAILFQPQCINTSRLSDTICRHRSGSTLVQVMACCLTAPSHYLNQCGLYHQEGLVAFI